MADTHETVLVGSKVTLAGADRFVSEILPGKGVVFVVASMERLLVQRRVRVEDPAVIGCEWVEI